MAIQRRTVLGISLLTMVIALAVVWREQPRPSRRRAHVHLPEATVALVQSTRPNAAELTDEDISFLVRDAVRLAGGLQRIVHNGDTVVLKPNLVTLGDYTLPGARGRPLPVEVNGSTTDWRVTKAVASLVRELNPSGKIFVVEGSANPTREAFAKYHYDKEHMPTVDDFIALDEARNEDIVDVSVNDFRLRRTYRTHKIFKQANVVINLPCLKNHWNAVVTGAVKNMAIGATPAIAYPDRGKAINHSTLELHQWIHDYYLTRPSDFVVMDGLQGIQHGPTPSYDVAGVEADSLAKNQKNMRLVLAGRDAIAVDTIESLVMGWDPSSVAYLQFLGEEGVGNNDPANIRVVGTHVDQVRTRFAGTLHKQAAGGAMIADSTPPPLQVTRTAAEGHTLTVSIAEHPDLARVEVSVGRQVVGRGQRGHLDSVSADLSALPTGLLNLEIDAYDSMLNRTHKTLERAVKHD